MPTSCRTAALMRAGLLLPLKQADGFAVQVVDGHHGGDGVPVTSVMPIIRSAQKQSS
jgi:hypothetical protein